MKIKGQLTVSHSMWKDVYNSIINYLNYEITQAYKNALKFYQENNNKGIFEVVANLETFVEDNKISDYQLSLIKSALFAGTSTKIYKPKKCNFTKLTNRTSSFNTESITITFFKKDLSIILETTSFEDFDKFIAKNTFISEFITMVNTIDWPTRQGPTKSIRGCILYTYSSNKPINIFYKAGINPPELNTQNAIDQTVEEPAHLKSKIFKNIKFVNTNTRAETFQPLPEPED